MPMHTFVGVSFRVEAPRGDRLRGHCVFVVFLVRHICGGVSSEYVCFLLVQRGDQLLRLSLGATPNFLDSTKGRIVQLFFFLANILHIRSNFTFSRASRGRPRYFHLFGLRNASSNFSVPQQSCQWVTVQDGARLKNHWLFNRVPWFRKSDPHLWALVLRQS